MEYFTNVPRDLRRKLQFDTTALFSITESRAADLMTQRIKKYAPDATNITDFTACVGGNTISFARRFEHVRAIEFDPKRASMLEHNVKVLGLDNVDVVQGDALVEVPKSSQDVLFGDPPWGGPQYKEHDRLDLFLGGKDIADVCNDFAAYTKLVALKVPRNFDIAKFIYNTFDAYKILDIDTQYRSMNLIIMQTRSSLPPGKKTGGFRALSSN